MNNENPLLFLVKCFIAAALALVASVALVYLIEKRSVMLERERCAAIAERTTSQTDYYRDICWVDINSDMPGIAPNWQPEEWLH